LKIGRVTGRSFPVEGGFGTPAPARRSHRAAALIVAALILLAAFVVTVPYLSAALKQGYSFLSGVTTTGPGTQTSTTSGVNTTGITNNTSTTIAQCSSLVSVGNLAAPDINNGSANIAYPSDYCTLASYALGQINADRAANGTGPVTLTYNQAAQQHADSMLYYGYFSHFDTQGFKPYMRYSLLGGRGADFENVAFFSYSVNHYSSTSAVEESIRTLEHSMVYDDVACCANGHKYNILDPLHNRVSIGVAYNSTDVFFDEEFENYYINLNFSVTGASASNPYFVTMTGSIAQKVTPPSSIYVAFDGIPSAENTTLLNNGPHEYSPGTLEGGILPKDDVFGGCPQFTTGTTVCADKWSFSAAGVDIAFSLKDFVKNYGPGVYTIYLITGPSTSSAITTISVFAP
jgi:uncharacterized protein YkwD